MKRILLLLLVLSLLPLSLAAADGPGEEFLSYEVFMAHYADALDFINQGEGRHLISLIFSSGETQGGTRQYTLTGDTLSATLYTQKSEKRVVGFTVRLTAPAGVEGSSTLRQDFTTSGYHCYALLMAMADGESAEERFTLVEELNNGLRDADRYETYHAPYTLCARREGSSVEFTFSSLFHEDEKTLAEEEAAQEKEAETTQQEDFPFPEEEDTSLVG